MSKKVIVLVVAFLLALGYLHQRVMIYVNAYELNSIYCDYNKLVDTRDVLLYNFSKEASLENINSWVEAHGYTLAQEGKVFAMRIGRKKADLQSSSQNVLLSSLNRFIRSTGISKAQAQERD
jgi:hypothetical protein